ncbi:MAG: hypothetical protein GXP62_16665, partial [Oligoflexia bacterium]|nr:hypothetical protein [Oligoflexia bacterium]
MKSRRHGPGIPVETRQVLSKHGVGMQQYRAWALHQVQRRARLVALVLGLVLTGVLGVATLTAALTASTAVYIPTWKRVVLAMLLGPGLGLLITVITQVRLSRPPDPERTEGQFA